MSFLSFGMSTQCKNKDHINQDKFGSIVVKDPSGKDIIVAAVADGVSMCYKGEIASYNTVRYIMNWSAGYFSKNEFDVKIIPEEFCQLIEKINQSLNLYSNSQKRKKLKNGYSPYSSCTLCCTISDGNTIMYFGIGDSSIYELKPYATINIMGNDKLSKHKNSIGKLTSYIGGIDDKNIDIRYINSKFDNSSAYFICTDGMSGRLIFDTEKNADFRKFNQRLISAETRNDGIDVLQAMTDYVLNLGETDDITALVVRLI